MFESSFSCFPFQPEHRRGMTLLEIMFATLILAFSLIPISGLLGSGTKATSQDYRMIEALQLLEKTANAVVQAPYKDIPIGTSLTTYATPPVFLGSIIGKYNTDYTVSLTSEFVPVSFQAQPVMVFSPGFIESAPRPSDFDVLKTYNYGNLVKRLTIQVRWREPNNRNQQIEVITFLASLQ